jgi:hypothetical protein
MQPVPTYEDLPVVFSAAPQVEIPDPTIDTGYNEGTALPTEHFSWLEYKVTQKIDELATSTLSLLGEMDSYLASRGVTPSGASVTQFQTALAAQIAAASVASAATCTGNSATATQATNALACSGNAATATKLQTARTITVSGDATGSTSFDGSGNVTISLDVTSANTSQACSGNAATATVAASCSGNAATAGGVQFRKTFWTIGSDTFETIEVYAKGKSGGYDWYVFWNGSTH